MLGFIVRSFPENYRKGCPCEVSFILVNSYLIFFESQSFLSKINHYVLLIRNSKNMEDRYKREKNYAWIGLDYDLFSLFLPLPPFF